VFKVYYKDLNAENVRNRLLKDVQNVKVYGIAQEIVKSVIGLNIKLNVMQKQNK
jgi:hypothetical protein